MIQSLADLLDDLFTFPCLFCIIAKLIFVNHVSSLHQLDSLIGFPTFVRDQSHRKQAVGRRFAVTILSALKKRIDFVKVLVSFIDEKICIVLVLGVVFFRLEYKFFPNVTYLKVKCFCLVRFVS